MLKTETSVLLEKATEAPDRTESCPCKSITTQGKPLAGMQGLCQCCAPLTGRQTGKVCASMPGGCCVKYRATSCLLPLLATSSTLLSGVHAAPHNGCAAPYAQWTDCLEITASNCKDSGTYYSGECKRCKQEVAL